MASLSTTAPCTVVIFGATGDLTKRKLVPALYKLHSTGKLHQETTIIAIGRKEHTDQSIAQEVRSFLSVDDASWRSFCQRLHYHQLEFHDKTAYDALKKKLSNDESKMFYLATPPDAFPLIIEQLYRTGLAKKNSAKNNASRGWQRVVFEKPFGNDLSSARTLNKTLTRLFTEQQIYRIDHYLGKGFVQNILVLRFTNPIFEELWNAKYIDNIQLVVVEQQGVGTRGGYYDGAGALRDMIQNHLLQLLSLTAIPLQSSSKKTIVLGQYTARATPIGQLPNYRDEKNVKKNSKTETFAAVKILVNNKRWKGTPFYLRTGKALKHTYAEIVVTFKQLSCKLFCGPDGKLTANQLIIRIQPDEGVKLQFNLKDENTDYSVLPFAMDFSHKAEFGMNTPEAYERLLFDVIRGDQTLFARWDEVEQAWRIVDCLRKTKVPLYPYAAGTHGPNAALDLLRKVGRDWSGNKTLRK